MTESLAQAGSLERVPAIGVCETLIQAGATLRNELAALTFHAPVTHVYNPLEYAWDAYAKYLRTYGNGTRRVVFLGMNPGPFGMVQTGVPFGEVAAVRDWLKIRTTVAQPERPHPKRPVLGFNCPRSEISGKRLWGLFAARFGSPAKFFEEHFVMNYCPLAFMEATGRNLTPDKLTPESRRGLQEACDRHLRAAIGALQPEWIIGVGAFSSRRASEAFAGVTPGHRIGQVLHPSPACPAANRDWAGTAEAQLRELGVWKTR
jgi:single-strand selective monofunctional uracil DNA glycosylase